MLTMILPIVLALSPQQEPKTITELLPLHHICTPVVEHTPPAWGSLLRFRENNDAAFVTYNDDTTITPDAIVSALHGLAPDAIDEERLFLQTMDSNLLAVGDSTLVAQVAKYLAEAADIVARPVQIELSVWNAAGNEAADTILDASAFESFTQNRTPLWRTVSTANAGQPVSLEHMTWSRYVRGIEIEVAHKKTMTSPATERYGEGSAASVRAFSLVGSDDFAVHLQFALAERRGVVYTLHTGMPGAPDIEMPRLESYFGTCSGRIQNGGALAASMRGNAATGGQLTLTLRVISSAPATTLSDQRAALLPVGALISEGLTFEAALPNVHSQDDSLSIEQTSAYGMIPSDNLQDLLAGVLASKDDDDEHEIHVGGGYAFVRGTPAGIARATRLLQSLQDSLIRNVEIRHSADLQALPGETASDATRPILHELSLPSLLGREATVYRLHETNIVASILVEVASEAGGLVPGIQLLQSGCWFRARAVPLGPALHASIDLLCVIAPLPPIRSVMPGGGVLMQAQVASARADHDSIVAPDQVIDHGDGPRVTVDGRTYRSTMTTTFRR